ncbi:MAG TPA: FAD-linked oxidase C-terminal domain-containing protein [Gemmataceae bacterium]|nr:FAD-linked oxidase C-terminal domain-containing protein [Gemmataceae bacterium]
MDLRRLQDDLHGFFKGEILFDDISRTLYSTDASIFQIKPAGIVVPRDEDDVCGLVRYAQDQGIALIPRGAGSGLAGESLGAGLIIDMSRHFREILEVGSDTVRVQPGVTWAVLNARLAETGRRFAPDPASGDVCTIGGMLANNASGARAIKYGYTRDHVAALRVVLDNGDVANLGRTLPLYGMRGLSDHLHDIITALSVLLEETRDVIRTAGPRTSFDRLGYHLEDVLSDETLDLPRLLVGSEGTLAMFTEATLRTMPIPAGRAVLLVNSSSLERALQTVQRVLATGPSACELLDRRLLSMARVNEPGFVSALISQDAEAVLLIEYESESPDGARRVAESLAERLGHDSSVIKTLVASEPEAQKAIWQIRAEVLPSLYGQRGGAQPVAHVEDVAVPVETLSEYLRRVQDIMQEHETTASFLVHAGAGQVHTRPFLDMQKPDDVSRLWSIADKVHALALELGGTVSSQHGTGLARTSWVARQYGPLYPILRQVKAIFDPKNTFNPGKIVDPDPNLARPVRPAVPFTEIPLRLAWQPGEVAAEASHCNGCGQCRTESPQQRMCPIFRAKGVEDATPRAKANMLRALLQAQLNGTSLSAEEVRTVADLCVNCKMCAHECPAHVNVPKLMLEAKAANVAEHGMDSTDWIFARMEDVLGWGSAVAFVANHVLRSRTARWLLDRFLGVSATRRFPRFAARSFLARARRRGWTRKPSGMRPVVVYFVDLYANYIDPQIAEATVLVLRHQGFDVWVPAEQRASGVEAFSHGDIETAREIAQQNVRLLVEAARAGWPIVCSEPSAAIMLKQDYLAVQNDDDARAVAAGAVESTTFLGQLHQQGKLRTDFGALRLNIGHHVPCHVKALSGPVAGPGLLHLIPELQLNTIDVGCSGMAGTFGMKSANYDLSRQAGHTMLTQLRGVGSQFGSTECSACRMQMEDGAGKRTLHPAQYLALAYGLLPEVADRLREPIRDLVLR